MSNRFDEELNKLKLYPKSYKQSHLPVSDGGVDRPAQSAVRAASRAERRNTSMTTPWNEGRVILERSAMRQPRGDNAV